MNPASTMLRSVLLEAKEMYANRRDQRDPYGEDLPPGVADHRRALSQRYDACHREACNLLRELTKTGHVDRTGMVTGTRETVLTDVMAEAKKTDQTRAALAIHGQKYPDELRN